MRRSNALAFDEWCSQDHTLATVGLPDGCLSERMERLQENIRRLREKRQREQEGVDEIYYEGLGWLDDLEDNGDEVIYYSEFDCFPGEPESIEKQNVPPGMDEIRLLNIT